MILQREKTEHFPWTVLAYAHTSKSTPTLLPDLLPAVRVVARRRVLVVVAHRRALVVVGGWVADSRRVLLEADREPGVGEVVRPNDRDHPLAF